MMRSMLLSALLLFAFAVHAAGPVDTGRIVVADGGFTETLYALGVADRIVGVDTTSQWPVAAREKPSIGYMRALSAEGILSLSPTLVLASDEAGPPQALALVKAAGVPVIQFPAPRSADDVRATIRGLAKLLNREKQGQAIIAHLDAQLREARAIVAGHDRHPRVLLVLDNSGQLLAAGQDTAAAAIIKLAGGNNVAGYSNYKPLTPEAAVQLAPDVILAPDFAVEALGSRESLLSNPAVALTPAGQNNRLVVMNGQRLLGFGPRLGATVAELARRLAPPEAVH